MNSPRSLATITMAPKKPKPSRSRSHRSTLSLQKTEIIIHVYDLLPPGRFSNVLWTIGTPLLHSGVVINGKEYAFGGHDQPGMTGVYWTNPRTEPPGGTFRCEILHGFTLATEAEVTDIIRTASEEFQGPAYNLLTRNCNHFTAYLCLKLTGRPGPGWLNRAASIGVALPCVVPRDWVEPFEGEAAEGALLADDELASSRRSSRDLGENIHLVGVDVDEAYRSGGEDDLMRMSGESQRDASGRLKGKAPVRDSGGRKLPAAETVPTP